LVVINYQCVRLVGGWCLVADADVVWEKSTAENIEKFILKKYVC
jgi:hypothetical protein